MFTAPAVSAIANVAVNALSIPVPATLAVTPFSVTDNEFEPAMYSRTVAIFMPQDDILTIVDATSDSVKDCTGVPVVPPSGSLWV